MFSNPHNLSGLLQSEGILTRPGGNTVEPMLFTVETNNQAKKKISTATGKSWHFSTLHTWLHRSYYCWNGQEMMGDQSATAIFESTYEDFECIVTSSKFSFKAICKVQPLKRVDKLFATTANSMFCLCFALYGSETEEAELLPLQFHSC